MSQIFITTESVTEGHPDKVCDQIADAILDAYLAEDPKSRVAVEVFGTHGFLLIGGEVTSKSNVDVQKIAEETYRRIGYQEPLEIASRIVNQSPDIAQGVDTGGAGDQGIMYGYATNETKEYMPQSIMLVHALTKGLAKLRSNHKDFAWLRPDGKAQITFKSNAPSTILISTQHKETISPEKMKGLLIQHLVQPIFGDSAKNATVLVNPTGRFVVGGFEADTGLTGRKIMVDTYCGLIPHGGGSFSGKDPTKVDRSATYMARFVAKNLVANGICERCQVSVAYAIGKANPVMLNIDTFGQTQGVENLVKKHFDFRPQAIIERLGLRRPIYQKTASYGHFGREGLPWEEVISL